MSEPDLMQTAKFLFEVGTMRKIPRAHMQLLHTSDLSDNIASHSYRVAVIGYFLAKLEGADAGKVMLMCLLHDVGETRTGDQNWVHKRYVEIDEMAVARDQLASLFFSNALETLTEYAKRESREAIISKDADILDQLCLKCEHAMEGNEEAKRWLRGRTKPQEYNDVKHLKTLSAQLLGKAIYDTSPSSWWYDVYTRDRKSSE